ncbi:crotonase/enoyl-CoA hydratase family protein [Propylenella binzhouense]|uniref:Enoyl-CoA hydratase n=1 Tax=Propylenella binzhouense TaxID=2555902 RepID=A0A964T5H6_9HYPH|nr:crotonase/enoyl-CoA hydratase family protein [Propylenella binzhouense]MYZ48194.1 enoyl-CoA hydratase [Propylenella binzhouense]
MAAYEEARRQPAGLRAGVRNRIAGVVQQQQQIQAQVAGHPGDSYEEIEVALDEATATFWCMMRPLGPPSYTPGLLRDLSRMQARLRQLGIERAAAGLNPLRYFVVGSKLPGIFNLGGDLSLFAKLIRAGDREELRRYARACVDVVYENAVSYGQPLVTIALVAGDALGGGFEAALSCDVIVAERSTRFGLPEILFNLFPGMGAYSFISRRLDAARATKMIMSGRIYTADELYEMGLVDIVVPDGEGLATVKDYVARNRRRHNAVQALQQVRKRVAPLELQELVDVVEIWVDAALRLTEADLRKMERLAGAQDRRRALDEARRAAM